MRHIDRLIIKAHKIRPGGTIIIVEYDSGIWRVDGRQFPDQQEAIKYAEELAGDEDGPIIVNDADFEAERCGVEYAKDQTKDQDAGRDPQDAYKGDEYVGKRRNRLQNGKYHHTWV